MNDEADEADEGGRKKRKAVANESKRWPKSPSHPTIPYDIEPYLFSE